MEFFLFAGLMALDMLLFFYLAARYTYVQVEKPKGEEEENKESATEASLSRKPVTQKSTLGTENKGFSDDTTM